MHGVAPFPAGTRPVVRKARLVTGNAYRLRNAGVDDAAFIVALRTDEKKRRYISATSARIDRQREWLARYAADDTQAYFIVETAGGDPMGTVRLYDPQGDSFCFGSWVMRPGAPAGCAIESVLLLYHYALDELGFSRSRFSVRKANRSVWHFMESFGGRRVAEDDLDYHYETDRESVTRSFRRYARYLPRPIQVIRDPVS